LVQCEFFIASHPLGLSACFLCRQVEKKLSYPQEGVGSMHNFWTARVKLIIKIIYSESWCRELSIGIYTSRIERGGGVSGGVQSLLDPPSKSLLGHWGGLGSITFGRHVTNRLKIIYSESWCRELSIGIIWVKSEGGGPEFFGPPLQKFTGSLLRKFKYIIGILSSKPVDWHPFWAYWIKGGVCGHVQKSEAHALRCRPRGESSQWSSNLPQTYRIVPAWDSQWDFLKKGSNVGLCKPVMGAW